ncbi:MAG: SpaA isopeptide-forming pilin-related protein, partial [Caldiserica bacterium]|nr:SpaA isopeptide-forming pilin-related protein [Caldisericota bacterium]
FTIDGEHLSFTFTATNSQKLGSIEVLKLDGDTQEPLAGVTFTLWKDDVQINGSKTTDETGIVSWDNLTWGTYTVKEDSAPVGYDIAPPQTGTIDGDHLALKFTFRDYRSLGKVTLNKVYEGTPPSGSVSFTLSGPTGSTKVLNGAGTLVWENLEWGTYTLSESAPEGYLISGLPQTFTITSNTLEYTFTATNTQIRGRVDITKTGVADLPLPGVGFTLYVDENKNGTRDPEDNTVQASGTTDLNGQLSFLNIPYGYYILVESTIPTGYLGLPDRPVVISSQGQVVTFNLENTVITGTLTLRKISTGGTGLAGAEFTLFGPDGVTPVRVGTTDSNGTLTFYGIPYGSYTLKETKAPEGYYEISTTWNVVINSQGIVINLGDIVNTPVPPPPTPTPPPPETPPPTPQTPPPPPTPQTPPPPPTPEVGGETATPPPSPTPSPEVGGETALPVTGVPITYLVGIGALLLILGGVLFFILRRGKREDF